MPSGTQTPDGEFGPGVSEEALRRTILRSGYPLQVTAVDCIVNALDEASPAGTSPWATEVQEEWSFLDADEGKVRNLDALVSHHFASDPNLVTEAGHLIEPGGCLRFHLDLLVECQQSELPFIFFLRPTPHGKVPRLMGLPHEEICFVAQSDQQHYGYRMSTYDALGLHQFGERTGAPTAIAMRRLRRKGADFELSGDEVFRELTLPLTKAFQHYSELIQANRGPTQLYYDVHCIGLLGVLRAPMVGVQTVDNEVVIESLPWIRVVRIDPGPEADQAYSTATVLDAVHIDMLPEYVAHMYAVAAGCARRVSSNSVAVISGEALWRESSEEDVGSDDAEQKVVDDLEFRKLEPTVSAEEFLNQWRDRFHELHSRSDGDAPMARIARYEPRRP